MRDFVGDRAAPRRIKPAKGIFHQVLLPQVSEKPTAGIVGFADMPQNLFPQIRNPLTSRGRSLHRLKPGES